MARIRCAHTKPELALRRALWRGGLRFRLTSKLPGKPDLIFTRARLAVFVDGCFWHGCPLHGIQPKSNQGYWGPKIERNRARDRQVMQQLADLGWLSLRFWEHEIKESLETVTASVTNSWRSRIALHERHES
ncbi:very short patch repair endonuclease [Methylosinus sporium]